MTTEVYREITIYRVSKPWIWKVRKGSLIDFLLGGEGEGKFVLYDSYLLDALQHDSVSLNIYVIINTAW